MSVLLRSGSLRGSTGRWLLERWRAATGRVRSSRVVDVSGIASLLMGVVLVLLSAPLVNQAAGQAALLPTWWMVLAGAPLVAAVPAVFVRRERAGALMVWAGACGAMLTMPLVLERRVVDEPWPMVLLPTAAAATVLLSRRRGWTEAALVAVLLGSAAVCRYGGQVDPDPRLLAVTSAYGVVVWAVARLLYLTLATAADRMEAVHADAVHEFAHARAAEATVRAAQAWDSYVHDEVIATLATISAGGESAVARRAAIRIVAGSEEIDEEEILAPSLSDGALESVLQLLPSADTDFATDHAPVRLPSEVRRALLEALSEALRNVERHAHPDGTRGRTVVRLRHHEHGVEARVTDDGVGFDIARVDPSRLGIAISVQGRMDSVGGSGRITSRPGVGTSVVLRWPVP